MCWKMEEEIGSTSKEQDLTKNFEKEASIIFISKNTVIEIKSSKSSLMTD